jgi:hypothetical protein
VIGWCSGISLRFGVLTVLLVFVQGGLNYEVKSKFLGAIQSWASAFKSKNDLTYVVDTYNSLKQQGKFNIGWCLAKRPRC